jgi:hypothetical protein
MRALIPAAIVLAAATAHANGRAPLTNGIYFKPGDPHSLYVASTFGLLISRDEGCTFHWLCEQNLGYGGTWDPKYAIAADGTIFATTFDGLRVSRDGGCSFQTATADLWIDALDIGPTGEVWIGTAETGQPNDVYVSTDNGVTFASRGLASQAIWWKSVKVAPSDASRVYVTGYQVAGMADDGGTLPPTPHLYRSSDGGAEWTASPLAGVQLAATPVLLVKAIDPADPSVLYVTSVGANPPSGDRLYRSTDGGETFAEVLATTAAVHDVVIRTADHVLIATQFASPQVIVGGTAYQSLDGGLTFEVMPDAPQLACLGLAPDGTLVGCGANWQPDYKSVARSRDGGATWEKVWRFVELAGPLACPPGTPEHDVCELGQWDTLRRQFGATGPVCGDHVVDGAVEPPPPKNGGCCGAGGGSPLPGAALVVIAGAWARRRRAHSAARQLG